MPFARIIALEHAVSGSSIIYTGFVPTMLAAISAQTLVYNASVYRPITRSMDMTRASMKVRKLYRLSKDALRSGLAYRNILIGNLLTVQGCVWLLRHSSTHFTTMPSCKDWVSSQPTHTYHIGDL